MPGASTRTERGGRATPWVCSPIAATHAPFQLGNRHPALSWQSMALELPLSVITGFTVKQIMNEPLAGPGILSDFKFSLGQPERNAFTALVQNQKRDHLLTQAKFDLSRHCRLSVAKNPAAVHDCETVRRQ